MFVFGQWVQETVWAISILSAAAFGGFLSEAIVRPLILKAINPKDVGQKPIHRWWLTIVSFVVLASSVLGSEWLIITGPLEGAVTDGHRIIAYNKDGQEMWAMLFSRNLLQPVVTDIDNDGHEEVVIVCSATEESSSTVYIYRDNKAKVIEKEIQGRSPYSMEYAPYASRLSGENGPLMDVISFQIVDFNDDGSKEVLMIANAKGGNLSQVALLDLQGNWLWTYWHPGLLQGMMLFYAEHSPSTAVQLIVWGLNPSLTPAEGEGSLPNVIFALRPDLLLQKASNQLYWRDPTAEEATWSWVESGEPVGEAQSWYKVVKSPQVAILDVGVATLWDQVDVARCPMSMVQVSLSDKTIFFFDQSGSPWVQGLDIIFDSSGRITVKSRVMPDTTRANEVWQQWASCSAENSN